MRSDKYAKGAEIAWIPQGLSHFLELHGEQLRKHEQLSELLDKVWWLAFCTTFLLCPRAPYVR